MARIGRGKLLHLLSFSALALTMSSTAHAQSGDTIPPDFRGKIVYDGTMSGTVEVRGRGGAHVNAFGFNVNIPTTQNVPINATDHQEIEFNGNTFRGSGWVRGSANGSSTFTGTRQGDICTSVGNDGRQSVFRCTMSAIVGDDDYVNPQGQHVRSHTEMHRTGLVDFAERDRQAAAAHAAAQQKAAQEAAYLASRPRASAAQSAALGRAIAQDSQAWSSNRYDGGSLHDVVVLKSGRDGTTLRGNYTFNGGQNGWVQAQVGAGKVLCLEYWDFAGICNSVRLAEHQPKVQSRESQFAETQARNVPATDAQIFAIDNQIGGDRSLDGSYVPKSVRNALVIKSLGGQFLVRASFDYKYNNNVKTQYVYARFTGDFVVCKEYDERLFGNNYSGICNYTANPNFIDDLRPYCTFGESPGTGTGALGCRPRRQ